jgi:hypothetical protein
MPIGQNPTARQRYLQAVELRDRGYNFTQIASALGYQRSSNARHAWIQGLHILGRTSEVPATRTVRIHSGRTTHTVTAVELIGLSTNFDYTFGIEIECIGQSPSQCARSLTAAGVRCDDAGYTHAVMPQWKAVRDGSLSTYGNGGAAEVVSPVLRGQDGMNQIRTVMGILRDAGSSTNTSCGMHIHIGMDSLTATEQARVILQHCKWQAAFDAFITVARQSNSYASKRTIGQATQLAEGWADNSRPVDRRRSISENQGRYYTLNLNSFYKYGTFEFRMHGGSLNGTNATAWIALHHGFIAACAANDLPNIMDAGRWAGNDDLYTDLLESLSRATRTTRETQKHASSMLLDHLYRGSYITEDVYNHLTARACNLPARTN